MNGVGVGKSASIERGTAEVEVTGGGDGQTMDGRRSDQWWSRLTSSQVGLSHSVRHR